MSFDDLARAMRRFDEAVQGRDPVAAEAVLDHDFALVLVHPAPAVMPRARWLEVLKHYVVHSYAIEHQYVDVDHDVAAVLSRVSMEATVLGEDRSGQFVISDLWLRRPGGWRVGSSLLSSLSGRDARALALNRRRLTRRIPHRPCLARFPRIPRTGRPNLPH